ncbi:YybH family protein [Pseudorhodoferax sp.]|uniref:YybH family protein n=1 Tax=Pseudorhodoferax sp. TaxID=1993553 RepID=UPI0039E35542
MTTTRFSEAQDALDQAVAGWNRAGSSWNADALAATYAEDGLLFGGRPGHFVGREAIRGYFASYDGVILAGTMQMSDTELRVLAPGCVLAQGMVEFTFTLAGNEQTRSTLRATLVLTQVADGWRIADHHFSTIPAAPPLGKD